MYLHDLLLIGPVTHAQHPPYDSCPAPPLQRTLTRACSLLRPPPKGDEFAMSLADTHVVKSEKLSTLRLSGCAITDDGCCVLAKAFETVGA